MRKKEKTIDFLNDLLSKFSQVVFASVVIGPIVLGKPNILFQSAGIILIAGLIWAGIRLIQRG